MSESFFSSHPVIFHNSQLGDTLVKSNCDKTSSMSARKPFGPNREKKSPLMFHQHLQGLFVSMRCLHNFSTAIYTLILIEYFYKDLTKFH